MALANFFDKTALGASQILLDYDRNSFESTLDNEVIAIVFGKNATHSHEGRTALDLLVRLASRLYPKLQFVNIDGDEEFEKELIKLAQQINPRIELDIKLKPTITIVAGQIKQLQTENTFFVGSDGWTATYSIKSPLTFGDSLNPFGAGVAVCFVMANVFRKVFAKQLPSGDLDEDFSFSVLKLAKNAGNGKEKVLKETDLGDFTLAGIGAIGNGVLWSLKNNPLLTGNLCVIDKQEVELSNLQRYVITNQDSVDKLKVDIAEDFLSSTGIKVTKSPKTWEEHVIQSNNYNLETVLVGVDSAEGRMAVQGTLPKTIFNAWTQTEAIGISRHLDFLADPCLVCLYIPRYERKHNFEIIAERLGIPEKGVMVRDYLADEKPVDMPFLKHVCGKDHRKLKKLKPFLGLSVEIFQSKVVCGGILLPASGSDQEMEVPMAFESALAGILLVAEMVIHAGAYRETPLSTVSRMNLLRPLSDYINVKQLKHHSGRCICQDEDYREVYANKWGIETKISKPAIKLEKVTT